jgi:prepilin peptidase CpaA
LLFSLRICGGGDVKLLAAVSLWAGPMLFLPMLVYTSLCGGVMALVLWVNHRMRRSSVPGNLNYTAGSTDFSKQPMPYAVAIAAGGLFVALQLLMGI